MRPEIRPRDLVWAVGTPIYWLLGTLRHEGSHAIAGLLCGARVKSFVFWPSRLAGTSYWGYVRFEGRTPLISIAAPYLVDLITVVVSTWLCRRWLSTRRALWINVALLGVVAPIVDATYNYARPTAMGIGGDVAGLLMALGPVVVHAGFILTMLVFGICLVLALERRDAAVSDHGSLAPRLVESWWAIVGLNAVVLAGTVAIWIARGDRFGWRGVRYYAWACVVYVLGMAVLALPLLGAAVFLDRAPRPARSQPE